MVSNGACNLFSFDNKVIRLYDPKHGNNHVIREWPRVKIK